VIPFLWVPRFEGSAGAFSATHTVGTFKLLFNALMWGALEP
jgi:hypothetical protein